MSDNNHVFTSKLTWKRTTESFAYDAYDRSHDVVTGSGVTLPSSASPAFRGSPTRINPEEMLVAALSSCHMLTFLAIAAKKRFVVDRYDDAAEAVMEKDASGKMSVTRCTLRPVVAFSGDKQPTQEEQKQMHHTAHEGCFIASSVKTHVDVVVA